MSCVVYRWWYRCVSWPCPSEGQGQVGEASRSYFCSVLHPTGDQSTSVKRLQLPDGFLGAVHYEGALLSRRRALLTGRMTKADVDECLFQVDLGCPQESLLSSRFTPPLWISWPLSFGSVYSDTIIMQLLAMWHKYWVSISVFVVWFGVVWRQNFGKISVLFNYACSLYANRKKDNSSRSGRHVWIQWRSKPTVRDERMQALAAGSEVRIFLALWAAIMFQTSELADTRRVMKGSADSLETPGRGYLFVGVGLLKLEQRGEGRGLQRGSNLSCESVLEAEIEKQRYLCSLNF